MPKYAVLSAANIEGVQYNAGAVVECSEALAKPLVSGGWLEPNKEAIAHREGEGEIVRKHVKPKVESDQETASSAAAGDAEKR